MIFLAVCCCCRREAADRYPEKRPLAAYTGTPVRLSASIGPIGGCGVRTERAGSCFSGHLSLRGKPQQQFVCRFKIEDK